MASVRHQQRRGELDRHHAAGLYLCAGGQSPGGRYCQPFRSAGGAERPLSFCAEEGLFGRGYLYTRHEPSEVVVGYNSPEFDAEGRYVELRFDTPSRKMSIVSAYFPSGSSGEERQQAKFRFLAEFYPICYN